MGGRGAEKAALHNLGERNRRLNNQLRRNLERARKPELVHALLLTILNANQLQWPSSFFIQRNPNVRSFNNPRRQEWRSLLIVHAHQQYIPALLEFERRRVVGRLDA